MNTNLIIKNFRIFNSEGVNLPLKPLTILTGCNSSGKSSVVKALILHNEVLSKISNGEKEIHFDFSKFPISLLGNYEMILNRDSASKGDNTICIEIIGTSPFFGDGLKLSLYFTNDESDVLKEGVLSGVVISDKEGTIFTGGANTLHNLFEKKDIPDLALLSFAEFTPKEPLPYQISRMKQKYFDFCLLMHWLMLLGENYDRIPNEDECEMIKRHSEDFKTKYGDGAFGSVLCFYMDSDIINDNYKWGNIDPVIWNKAEKLGIVSYMPILEDLNSFTRDCFEEEFVDWYKPTNEDDTAIAHIIARGFIDSDHSLFTDYYRELEDKYLDMQSYSTLSSNNHIQWSNFLEDSAFMPEIKFPALFMFLARKQQGEFSSKYFTTNSRSGLFRSETYCTHAIFNDFLDFCFAGIKDFFKSSDRNDLQYIGSTRMDIKRVYDRTNPSDDIITRYVSALNTFERNSGKKYSNEFINRWVKEFGIGDRFAIESAPDGLGTILKIYKDEDDKGQLLADMGYGITQLLSILIGIETAILQSIERKRIANRPLKGRVVNPDIANLLKQYAEYYYVVVKGDYIQDYSVSHRYGEEITLAIEEPETHLHPDYQALLANMFLEAYELFGINFIIETHSEYLVRRSQIIVAERCNDLDYNPFSVIYFPQKGKPYEMVYNEDGHFDNSFGTGFFDAAAKDALKLSRLARKKDVK